MIAYADVWRLASNLQVTARAARGKRHTKVWEGHDEADRLAERMAQTSPLANGQHEKEQVRLPMSSILEFDSSVDRIRSFRKRLS